MIRRILIIDENKIEREAIIEILQAEYIVLEADNYQTAVSFLLEQVNNISAIFVGLFHSENESCEVLRRIRLNAAWRHIPVFVYSTLPKEKIIDKVLELGVHGIFTKPYHSFWITSSLRNIFRLRTAAAIVNSTRKDVLTGLFNREYFFEMAEKMIKSKEQGYYILSCLDIDNFKVINDQNGMKVGDLVLKHVAGEIMKASAQIEGICCRFMADKFAMLYPAEYSNSEIILALHCEVELPSCLERAIKVRIGRYLVNDFSLSVSTMLDRAAMAEKSIKGIYGVFIATYNESMREELIFEQKLVGEMKTALQEGQFEPWFQPQYNHATGALIGAEALIRWRHPDKGLLLPYQYIPVFEHNGFVYEVDKYMWEEVCKIIREDIDNGKEALPVSVNISRVDIVKPDFFESLTGLIEKYDIQIDLLRLEITESAFEKASEYIVEIVRKLVDFGFVVEIDDFGSGYSSLNTLKDVPAQVLKLDMRFLQGESNFNRAGSIIESVVRMAKWLGMSVIAEGVEEKKQADYLKSIGCYYIQGYYYAKPMPLSEYRERREKSLVEQDMTKTESVTSYEGGSFWNPESIETLIFNSYVGGASIVEFHNGAMEQLRFNDQYEQEFDGKTIQGIPLFQKNPQEILDKRNLRIMRDNIYRAIKTNKESTCEIRIDGIDNEEYSMFIRWKIRVISKTSDRYMLYCVVHNSTQEHKIEEERGVAAKKLKQIFDNIDEEQLSRMDDNAYKQFSFLGVILNQLLKSNNINDVVEEIGDYIREILTSYKSEEKLVTGESEKDVNLTRNLLLDNIPCGAAVYQYENDNLTALFLNRQCMKYFDTEVKDDKELPLMDVIYEEDRQVVFDELRSAISQNRDLSADIRICSGNSNFRSFHLAGKIIQRQKNKFLIYAAYTPIMDEVMSLQSLLPKALSAVMNSSSDFTAIKDLNLNYICCSKDFAKFIGKDNEREVVGKTDFDIFPKERAECYASIEKDILETGIEVVNDEDILVSEDGKVRHSLTTRSPICDMNGKVAGIFCVSRDVSELYEANFELYTMLHTVPSGVLKYAADEGGEFAYVNSNFIKALGYTEGEFKKKFNNNFHDMIFVEDREKTEKEIITQEQDGRIGKFEFRIEAADGTLHWFHDEGIKVADCDGKEWYYVTLVDVTEKRKEDIELKLLNDSILGGVASFEYTSEGINVLYMNEGFFRFSEYSAEEYNEIVKQDVFALVFKEDQREILEKAKQIHEGIISSADICYRCRTKKGDYRWFNMNAVLAEHTNDRSVINVVQYDITEHKEMEEHIRITEEQYRLILEHGGNAICRYDISKGVLHIPSVIAAKYGIDEKINVHNKLFFDEMISPETLDDVKKLLRQIERGRKEGEVVFQSRLLNDVRWLEAEYISAVDAQGRPDIANIFIRDVTEQFEKEAIYQKWQQSLNQKNAESYTLICYNLSKDTSFDSIEGNLLNEKIEQNGTEPFNRRTIRYAVEYVCEEERDEYIRTLNSNVLLADFYRGRKTQSFEFKEIVSKDKFRWLRRTVELVEYPNSSDIILYLMFEDIDEEKRKEMETKTIIETDSLTGLLNRKAFEDKARRQLQKNRGGMKLLNAVFMVDLDYFKEVNDNYGHEVGDRALIEVGYKLRQAVREVDLVGRIGGDEFLVCICQVANIKTIEERARKMCDSIRRYFDDSIQLSASIGIAVCNSGEKGYEDMFHEADVAMYRVKESGKDNFSFFESEYNREKIKQPV